MDDIRRAVVAPRPHERLVETARKTFHVDERMRDAICDS
jgi:hypothetical protein